jgi:hypothetical protein
MKMKKSLFLLLGISLLTAACKKDDHDVIPPPSNTSNMSAYFTDNEDNAKQSFTLDATSGDFITGSNGTRIYIPGNSFIYSNGTTVSGNVNIELIEVLDVATMINLNKTTTSNGQVLVSGGQIKVTATQNSNFLTLAPGAALYVDVPTTVADPQMGLFTGTTLGDSTINWTPSSQDSSQTDSLWITTDSSGGSWYSFPFDNDSLGWINCDYFWNSGQTLTTITAITDTVHNYSNTAGFLVFPNINSVAGLYQGNTAGTFTASNFPVNTSATIVLISEINGTYYSAFVPITITTNHVENVSMQQTTLADIQNAINNL